MFHASFVLSPFSLHPEEGGNIVLRNLHLHSTLEIKAARSSETVVSYHFTTVSQPTEPRPESSSLWRTHVANATIPSHRTETHNPKKEITLYLWRFRNINNYFCRMHNDRLHKSHLCSCNSSVGIALGYGLDQWYSNFFPPVPLETLFHSTLYPQRCWCIIQVIHNYI
jgi:hypothetical protein